MRLKIIFNIMIFSCGMLFGQVKMESSVSFGWYEPELTGLESSLEADVADDVMRKNALFGYSVSIPIFPSARAGYTQSGSYYSGSSDTTEFKRKLVYRMISLETYYRPLRKLELNFTLAPMWNRGVINFDTKNTETVWDVKLGSYTLDVRAPEKMTINFFGFTSMIGVRYYFLSWLALDIKTGFMATGFNKDNWKKDGKKIDGPDLNLSKEAIFKAGLVYSW